jgi:hypothetical protein
MSPARGTASIERGGPEFESDVVDLDQIVERLGWTPAERLRYLLDMLDFEEKAHRATPADR